MSQASTSASFDARFTFVFQKYARRLERAWAEHVQNNFATEGGEVGGWAPLTENTKRQRINLGFAPGPILDMTGQLKGSWELNVNVTRGEISAELSFPSSLPSLHGGTEDYARKHHEGLNNIPQRLLFNEERLLEIFNGVVAEAIQEVFDVHGL